MMTEDDLLEIENRLRVITPFAWDFVGEVQGVYVVACSQDPIAECHHINDAVFIENAPTDVAKLIAEVRRLRMVQQSDAEEIEKATVERWILALMSGKWPADLPEPGRDEDEVDRISAVITHNRIKSEQLAASLCGILDAAAANLPAEKLPLARLLAALVPLGRHLRDRVRIEKSLRPLILMRDVLEGHRGPAGDIFVQACLAWLEWYKEERGTNISHFHSAERVEACLGWIRHNRANYKGLWVILDYDQHGVRLVACDRDLAKLMNPIRLRGIEYPFVQRM